MLSENSAIDTVREICDDYYLSWHINVTHVVIVMPVNCLEVKESVDKRIKMPAKVSCIDHTCVSRNASGRLENNATALEVAEHL
jgi:hypothetical protein